MKKIVVSTLKYYSWPDVPNRVNKKVHIYVWRENHAPILIRKKENENDTIFNCKYFVLTTFIIKEKKKVEK